MSAVKSLRMEPEFEVNRVRMDFPALSQNIHGKPWVYLDNGASSQTPKPVVDALVHFYQVDRANVHRGVHTVSQRATTSFEATRAKVASFVNAPHEDTCIFVRGSARQYGAARPDRSVALGQGEHRSLRWRPEQRDRIWRVRRRHVDVRFAGRAIGRRLISQSHLAKWQLQLGHDAQR